LVNLDEGDQVMDVARVIKEEGDGGANGDVGEGLDPASAHEDALPAGAEMPAGEMERLDGRDRGEAEDADGESQDPRIDAESAGEVE
jgi:hypothetical protein